MFFFCQGTKVEDLPVSAVSTKKNVWPKFPNPLSRIYVSAPLSRLVAPIYQRDRGGRTMVDSLHIPPTIGPRANGKRVPIDHTMAYTSIHTEK